MSSGTSKRALLILLSCVFLVGVLAVSAQATPTPITIGENKTGEVTDVNNAVAFAVAVGAPQSISVQVLAITPGFAPTFQVIDPGGIVDPRHRQPRYADDCAGNAESFQRRQLYD